MNQPPNKTDLSTTGPLSGLRQRFAQMTPQRRSFFVSLSVLLVLLVGLSVYKVVALKQTAGAQLGTNQPTTAVHPAPDPTTRAPQATEPVATTTTASVSPGPAAAEKTPATTATAQLQPAPVSLQMPVKGNLEQGYEWAFNPALNEWLLHPGLDFSATAGTRVMAATPGKISAIEGSNLYGQLLKIDGGGGMTLEYGGGTWNVKVGDSVAAGQAIGVLNNATPGEVSQGPHLHFAVLMGKNHIDPTPLFNGDTASIGH